MPGRSADRSNYPDMARLSLLEHDADEFEAAIATMRTLLIGVLVSTTTAAILLAINLGVRAAQ